MVVAGCGWWLRCPLISFYFESEAAAPRWRFRENHGFSLIHRGVFQYFFPRHQSIDLKSLVTSHFFMAFRGWSRITFAFCGFLWKWGPQKIDSSFFFRYQNDHLRIFPWGYTIVMLYFFTWLCFPKILTYMFFFSSHAFMFFFAGLFSMSHRFLVQIAPSCQASWDMEGSTAIS